MAKISLRMYNREIEGMIEQQRLEEAIAHCRHILTSYPKHLETYRLLGKAYLEAKRYDQAVDIFQRVLVAAPDDFVSHVGMSIISDDKGKLDDAVWHMERAFEVQPSNAAIQGELQRLFGRRDGFEPPKIRLTRGALAHMYVQGELYNQAISEIRLVLSNDPKRTDMQTLLARAYFRNGQKAEATETCTELLSRFAYCLDANRLMAEILPGTQHPEAAQEYRQRVVELDPYAAFVQDSLFHSETVADNLVSLERLEYTGETGEMPPALGIGLESDSGMMGRATSAAPQLPRAAGPASGLPGWLSGVAEESASQGAAVTPSPNKDDLPGFLRDAGWGASSETAVPEAPSFEQPSQAEPPEGGAVEGDLPEWVKALAPADSSAGPSEAIPPSAESSALPPQSSTFDSSLAGDTPDWLRSLDTMESSEQAPAASESPAPGPELSALPADVPDWLRDMGPAPSESAPAEPAPEETPDWLKDLAGRELDEPAAPPKAAAESDWLGGIQAEQAVPAATEPAAEESPDWLKEFSNDLETPIAKVAPVTPPSPPPVVPPIPPPAAPATSEAAPSLGALGTTAQEQDDAMAWLESLAAKHGAKAEELVTDPNARTDVAPGWVDKAKEIGEQAEAPVARPSEDETGIWLRGLEAEASGAVVAQPEAGQPAEEQSFDFRSSFTDQNEFASAAAESETEEPPIIGESEAPSWLRGSAAKTPERPGMEDAPEWLRGTSLESKEPGPPEAPRVEAETPRGIPEGAPVPPAEALEPAAEISDLPSWLAGLDEEQAPMTPPTTAGAPSEELPAWLQSEIEPEPELKEPARPTDWHPVQPKPTEVQQPPAETKPAPAPQPAAESKPAAWQPAPPAPVEVPQPIPQAQPVIEEAFTPPPPPPVRQPAVEKAPAPVTAPARPKPAPAAKPAVVSLGDAQTQLGRGNIPAALDIYGRLIRKGKSLEDIIHDLRDALYRYPVEVPLWQSLGDAYMRANRLQEALDAYTKAEELLR